MKHSINELIEEVGQLVASNQDELETLRIKYLSKKGKVSILFNEFRNVANEDKRDLSMELLKLDKKMTLHAVPIQSK